VEAGSPTDGLDFTGLTALAASNVQAAIASGDNFHGYIPSESLEFIVRNYRRLASMKALEAAWLDAYVHASNFKEYGVEMLKAVFDACDRDRLLELKPVGNLGAVAAGGRVTLFRGCAGSPEFDSSRHFRKSAFNEINNLEAIFAFWCGGTLLPY